MKSTWQKINLVLLCIALLTGAAAGYCAWRAFSFDTAKHEDEISLVYSDAASIRTEGDNLRDEMEKEAEAFSEHTSLLGAQGKALEEEIIRLNENKAMFELELAECTEMVSLLKNIQEETLAIRKEYGESIRKLEDKILAGESDLRICYWTLDDGPTMLTDKFLDVIEDYGIQVTFFTSREANENNKDDYERDLLRREASLGCTIANHTYSHQFGPYGNLYQTVDGFMEQVDKQNDWIKENTGLPSEIVRFPSGSFWCDTIHYGFRSSAINALKENGYYWIDWSNDAADSVGNVVYADTIVYIISQRKIAVLLSHDLNPTTLEAMKGAVPRLKDKGYLFLPLLPESWCMDKTTNDFNK